MRPMRRPEPNRHPERARTPELHTPPAWLEDDRDTPMKRLYHTLREAAPVMAMDAPYGSKREALQKEWARRVLRATAEAFPELADVP